MGVPPMSTTGIPVRGPKGLPVCLPSRGRAGTALRLMAKIPMYIGMLRPELPAGRALSVSDYPYRHGVDVLGQGHDVIAQAQDRAFADWLLQAAQGLNGSASSPDCSRLSRCGCSTWRAPADLQSDCISAEDRRGTRHLTDFLCHLAHKYMFLMVIPLFARIYPPGV